METTNNVEVQQVNKKKSPKKVLLIIAVIFIAVLILSFIFGEKVPDVKEADAITITADEIAEKFLNDKEGTDKEFHNKVYEITGIVEDSNGQYSITFNTESGEYEIYMDIDQDRSNKVPELEEGDTATVRGLYNRVSTDRIDFKNCLYMSSEKASEPTTETPIEAETEAKDTLQNQTEQTTEATVPKEYTNALKKAESYSDNMHMSKAAIHDQLTSEYGEAFSEEAADYAVEHLDADYKANALYKAKSYQDNMAMSPSAIYDQLISEYGEQFTEEEAQYAIDNLE